MATAGDRRGAGVERAYAPELPGEVGAEVVLSAEESRHLVRARRVRVGEAVVLFDGRGRARAARLVEADARGARLEVGDVAPVRDPRLDLTVALSPPESGRMDTLVAMLAELGVRRLQPFASERTPNGRADAVRRRRARFERIAIEALKVNGGAHALVVAEPQGLGDLLQHLAPRSTWLLDPDPLAPPLGALAPTTEPEAGAVLLGPEGGFTTAERQQAEQLGIAAARLTPTALRIETAAVAAAAVLLSNRG